MKSQLKQRIALQLKGYAQFMSLEAAVAKVKRNELGRIDFWIDQVAAEMEAEK